MKKLSVILLLTVMLLCSCNTAITDGETASGLIPAQQIDNLKYYNGYIYINPSFEAPVPYRINTETGNVTCVCLDPVCRHNGEDCSYYGLSHAYFIADGGDICFLRMNIADGSFHNKFVRYDSENQRAIVLEDFGTDGFGFGPEIYTDKWRIYSGQEYDAETDKFCYGLRKMDISNGKTEYFGASVGADGEVKPIEGTLLFLLDGRVYINDGETVFSLDFDGENRVDHIKAAIPQNYGHIETDGEYLYFTDYKKGTVSRISLSGGEFETVVMGAYGRSYLTKKYIYYFTGEDIVLGEAKISGYASDKVTLSGGEIWRCAHDGSGAELVYTFSGDTAGLRPNISIVVGNYFYCTYSWWEDADGDGVYRDGDNSYSMAVNGKKTCEVLRIDLTTGEAYIIEVIK